MLFTTYKLRIFAFENATRLLQALCCRTTPLACPLPETASVLLPMQVSFELDSTSFSRAVLGIRFNRMVRGFDLGGSSLQVTNVVVESIVPGSRIGTDVRCAPCSGGVALHQIRFDMSWNEIPHVLLFFHHSYYEWDTRALTSIVAGSVLANKTTFDICAFHSLLQSFTKCIKEDGANFQK